VYLGLDGSNENIADATQSPGGGVFDMRVGVPHHIDEDGQRLSDEWRQESGVRAVEYRTKGHYSSFAGMPVRGLDVTLNKWDYEADDRIADGLCEKREAGTCRHRDIPLVFVGIFLLACEQAENDRNNFWQSDFGEELAFPFGNIVVVQGLLKEYVMIQTGWRWEDDTSAASMANSISSSHTVDQNSTAWRATRSSGWFMPRTVNFTRVSPHKGKKEWIDIHRRELAPCNSSSCRNKGS
jgi:hypothetical protein